MEYDFNQLDPIRFQRLINGILIARFGEGIRLTPLRGSDGGRDGETAPLTPYFEFTVEGDTPASLGTISPPRRGRYLFQVKHHRTVDSRIEDVRRSVLRDFRNELRDNVLTRNGDEAVNFFFLWTNVPSSEKALSKLDEIRRQLLAQTKTLHADIWWRERLEAHLDQLPKIWSGFPEIFPGGQIPALAAIVGAPADGPSRAVRTALSFEYARDSKVRFRQIELEQSLPKLFADLDISTQDIPEEERFDLGLAEFKLQRARTDSELTESSLSKQTQKEMASRVLARSSVSGLTMLLIETAIPALRKIVVEGGPGQGKSTMTQMVAQIYRAQILGRNDINPDGRWLPPAKARLPFKIELRQFGEWLSKNPSGSVEEYLVQEIRRNSGGNTATVNDIHAIAERSPVVLIFDGLDEIGGDSLRDDVLEAIIQCTYRFEQSLSADLKVIITTRPPAIAGRRERLTDFRRATILPMSDDRISGYVQRWLTVQIKEEAEYSRILESFERRRRDPHVQALARNPMQLSVLLQFINLKGEAFPDRRAELYREYFQIVIDRDVEKSPELRAQRKVIEALHEFLGYKIHALTEVDQANRTLDRTTMMRLVGSWLQLRGSEPRMADSFFKLGEERFGLIVVPKGDGQETRYGFEIQPVQEYFAAAYISNQIPPDAAHEVFQLLIRRPYWHEVALFLAGLRRPNEKSDLVARARQMDMEDVLGWRQEGRKIILELSEEGVFSEPPHVYWQALDFVTDLLDADRLRIQNEPNALSQRLRLLTQQLAGQNARDYRKRLALLLQKHQTCQDEYALHRLYWVASSVMGDEIVQEALARPSDNAILAARLRLEWPLSWGVDLRTKVNQTDFWTAAPEQVWATAWWNGWLSSNQVQDLPAPFILHQHLAEEFAVSALVDPTIGKKGPLLSRVSSYWAVWQLVALQNLFSISRFFSRQAVERPPKITKHFELAIGQSEHAVYDGLDSETQQVVREMLYHSRELLTVLDDTDRRGKALERYGQTIIAYLEASGLSGWIAGRCAMQLILSVLDTDPEEGATSTSTTWHHLLNAVESLYRAPASTEAEKPGAPVSDYDLRGARRGLRYYRRSSLPKAVRLAEYDAPIPLTQLCVSAVADDSELPLRWLNRAILPSGTIRALLDKCKKNMPGVLRFLNGHRFRSDSVADLLREKDMDAILNVIQNTSDPNVISGARIWLTNPQFVNSAGPVLILKLLDAGSAQVGLDSNFFADSRSRLRQPRPGTTSADILNLLEIARKIVADPYHFDFRLVCEAAGLLAEHDRIALPPLITELETAGIQA